jgi:asparagine synthetase B (glutamine-hydrolysing)
MALNGFLFGEYSYWNAVRLLGPARRLVVDADRTELKRYWSPNFRPGETPPAEDLLHAVTTCMRGHLRPFEKPLLALSGGVDSRIMLACARRAGLPLSAVTWTYDERESDEADFAVAGRVAAAAGIPHVRHRLDDSHLPEQAAQIVASSDGLCGLLGAFTDRETLARRLSSEHDVILFGDQCYRGERHIGSRNQALERTGVRVGPRVSLVKFLMRPDAARACLDDYRAQIDGLLADIGPVASAHDLHDRLYWQVRVPRLLTGPKSLWRFYMNPVSPLLDIPMLELAQRLPAEQRAEKAFLRAALSEIAPDLCAVPFSTEHSRTKWRKIFRQNGPVQKFIVETLLDPQPEFDRWFDRASVAALLRGCMADAEGRRVPDDPGDRGLGRLRRSTTSLLLRPAFHPRVVINLLTLKLWFAQFAARR